MEKIKMIKNVKMLIFITLILCFSATVSIAQEKKAPDYSISKVKITPFDSQTGEFQEEYTTKSDRSFFNDLAISLFTVVEITGEAGSFEVGREIQITVTEGKKVKLTKTEQIGLIGEGGKFYIPVWLEPAMCDEVKITAKIIGQKTVSTKIRTIPFMCGE